MLLFLAFLPTLNLRDVGAPMASVTVGAFDLPITMLVAAVCAEKVQGVVSARAGSALADGIPAADEDPK
jgi:hypothetical protein